MKNRPVSPVVARASLPLSRSWTVVVLGAALLVSVPRTVRSADERPESAARPAASWPRDVPTFEVRWEIDVPVLVVAGTMAFGWLLSDTLASPHCAPLCDEDDLPSIDRGAAGNYDENWSRMSDIVVFGGVGVAALTLGLTESPLAALRDALIIAETALVANAIAVITTLAVRRPRPLMYGEEAPLERREEATAALSFFSGHTAVAFSVATGMFNLFRRRYGSSPITWIWLGVSSVAASMVALGRVMGGDHFPTDVIAGAAVGTAAGFIVPVFHASPEWGIQPVASHSTLGFKLSWM